ncbi:MAG: SRPBCC domain-containing protein [Acidobacteria bacterium]|nr:SRPBCC domain-containing protein [Acidobacteriota bacterium]
MVLVIMLLTLYGAARSQTEDSLVHEGIVNASAEQVWAAFTTKEGIESWMAAHAAVDFKLGGTMRIQYDAKGTVDDDKAIHNTIISYEPMRMLSFKVSKAPAAFPFANAIKNMWTVVYFEALPDKTTRVRVVSLGFGNDEQSKKMRDFFNRGNAFTLQRLQKRFAPKTDAK